MQEIWFSDTNVMVHRIGFHTVCRQDENRRYKCNRSQEAAELEALSILHKAELALRLVRIVGRSSRPL